MQYNEKDFSGCKYNPLTKDFAKKYSAVMECVSPEYEGDKEMLMRYVCLMYDYRSPLIRDTANVSTRQRIAAQYAGFKLNENELEQIFELTNPFVVTAVDIFLKNHIQERLAYMIFANEQTFYEYGKRLLQPVSSDKGEKDLLSAIAIKTKLSEDMAAISLRIDNDYKRLYMDDSVLQKAVAANSFTPEFFAGK